MNDSKGHYSGLRGWLDNGQTDIGDIHRPSGVCLIEDKLIKERHPSCIVCVAVQTANLVVRASASASTHRTSCTMLLCCHPLIHFYGLYSTKQTSQLYSARMRKKQYNVTNRLYQRRQTPQQTFQA